MESCRWDQLNAAMESVFEAIFFSFEIKQNKKTYIFYIFLIIFLCGVVIKNYTNCN